MGDDLKQTVMPNLTPPEPEVKPLNPKQQLFVDHYLTSLNAKQAAIKAGYSERSAEVQGSVLLSNPKVKSKIDEAMAKRSKKLQITAERVLRELAIIAFSDMGKFADWSGNTIKLKNSEALRPGLSRVIQEVSERSSQLGSSVKIKLYDKLKALELLGDHLGLYTEEASTPETDKALDDALAFLDAEKD